MLLSAARLSLSPPPCLFSREHDKLSRQSDEQNELFKQHQTDDMQLEENLKLVRAKMKKLKTSLKTDREKVRSSRQW